MADRPLPRGISARVHSDGTTHYRARLSYEGKQYQVGEFFTIGDARAALDIARSAAARGLFTPTPEKRRRRQAELDAERAARVTVADWAETWLAELRALVDQGKRSPGTLRAYRSIVHVHIIPALGRRMLSGVTDADIAAIGEGKSAATRSNIVRVASAMFRAAAVAGAGGLTQSPVSAGAAVKLRRGDVAAATLAEVAAIAARMPLRLRPAVWLAATVGLRLGEVLGLQRRDLDLDGAHGPTVAIRRQWLAKAAPPRYTPPKAGSGRTLALPATLAAMLREHLVKFTGPKPESPVFPSSIDQSAPMSQTALAREWTAARDAVKPGYRFHDLRHVALTLYNQQGATPEEVQRRGGHTSADVAATYQFAQDQRDRELTDRLDAALKAATKGGDG